MSLNTVLMDFVESWGAERQNVRTMVPAHYAFMAGAAAMAEIFATQQAPTQELIKSLLLQIASDTEELHRHRLILEAGKGK